MKPGAIVTVIFLSLVSLLHLLRLILSVEVVVDGTTIPMWVSIFAFLGPGALAIWLWHEQQS